MCGRLIRSEVDRGVVVIVEARAEKGYFRRLREALPPGVAIVHAPRGELPRILAEVGIGGGAR
jgi:Rad3-related DNA helicase